MKVNKMKLSPDSEIPNQSLVQVQQKEKRHYFFDQTWICLEMLLISLDLMFHWLNTNYFSN